MAVSRKKFKTEVSQLLDLVIHSLYTNRDIFLRELISNASDAIDRVRFEVLSKPDLLEDNGDWKIKIAVDREARTLTVSDNGLGMTAEELDANIGTIASSGTRRFLEQLKEKEGKLGPELIGQFGVGFYSAFMVADKVTVLTRPAGAPATATLWTSDGLGGYTLEAAEKPSRGSDVTLHLKEGMDEYLDEWKIRKIVKTYSDFVEHPVAMDVRRDETPTDDEGKPVAGAEKKVTVTEETLNSRKAIWAKPRSEVTADEYNQFYRHVSHDFQDPLEVLHWNVEGAATEFRALLYIPTRALLDLFMPENLHRGVQLYVRKVFITSNCEALIPQYLRFLRGVVESADLPLNVSRETLQEDRLLRTIRNNLVKKVLDTLAEMRDKNRDRYVGFWKEYGRVLKEGVHLDLANREKLQDLLLYETSATAAGTLATLKEYVARMPDTQKEIYYLTGESRQALEKSPHLEAFRARSLEVVFMADPIDEWVVQALSAYAGKSLKCIDKGDVALEDLDDKATQEQRQKAQDGLKPVADAVKAALGDRVRDVRFSRRLTESACCLVSEESGFGVQMEKIMRAMQHELPPAKRILELNATHPLLAAMHDLVRRDAASPKVREYAELLYDQALLTAGLTLDDPVQFAKRISALMAAEAKGQSQAAT